MSENKPIVQRILDKIEQEHLPLGAHLSAQTLADHLNVSRSPVNRALIWLAKQGVLKQERNRGYFIACSEIERGSVMSSIIMPAKTSDQAYLKMADDCFKGLLPQTVSESYLRERYELRHTQLKAVLQRIVREGWVSKKPGYGWQFFPMLNSPDSLMQTYRLRIAVEPAALLEPNYHLSAQALQRCREVEHHLLAGGIENDTADQIHERGVHFHETLVEASGNPFFIETVRRVNQVRRLISYRSMLDRNRYFEQSKQHLKLLDLIEQGQQEKAADFLRCHLMLTLENHQKIQKLLKP
jgi:DNA-binding GntR family transcriptional regulator|tara:strand:- start:545 stop:1435 length:891 start_codon:yes stop_codon:yes gene_type:complete